MITDRMGQHKILLLINHKKYNFWENKNSQVMKERENLHQKMDKGGISMVIETNIVIGWYYHFGCDWLI